MIYIFKEDKMFPISRLLLPYNTKDSAIFNQKIKGFDYYLSKIDSIESAKRK
jgi:hypothetical protein